MAQLENIETIEKRLWNAAARLRRQVAELEASGTERKRAVEAPDEG